MLDGKNYHMWARQVTFGLIGRDKLEYVNGENLISVPKVSGDPTEEEKRAIKEWRKNDNRTYSWLIATMESHVAYIISYQNTTQQM
jgi:gag-polypeptide of LTR copia-type